ncbi:cupin-like domain-containing protein [Tengunoibacter tsumagoiensis]|uniref:JmjC domain-containing protein n=1 Tax=Tengunoibacter tsumagoiensis TaxID=2014871 RepID=A0A402A9N1_9CHLR|nr:cupin-like domain-containing protein [Tengunoibacter tsumagoiensis]GCE15716.1 hypothetical protein KTT_55750 [Tengunoibacter tsumagoiensis]
MLKEHDEVQQTGTRLERIHRPSYNDFYQNYFKKSRPVIITGVADQWDALSKWTIEYLRSSSEDQNMEVVASKGQSTIGNQEKGWKTHRKLDMGFKEFLTRIENKDDSNRYFYLQYQSFDKFPHLRQDFTPPTEYIRNSNINTRIWIGSGQNITPLHHDTQSNLLTQITGRKKFTLFSPSESQSLYPFPFNSPNRTLSPVNLHEPDLQKYPRFKNAHPIEGILEPGEMIFQPAFWWHQVETLSTEMTISITFMWPSPLHSYFSYLGIRNLASRVLQGTNAD